MKKKLIIAIAFYLIGVLSSITINFVYNNIKSNVLENKVIYSIRVTVEKINLRPEIDLTSDIIKEVYKGEEFKVIKYYEGNSYNWYEVIYDNNKTGWLASSKKTSWVDVI